MRLRLAMFTKVKLIKLFSLVPDAGQGKRLLYYPIKMRINDINIMAENAGIPGFYVGMGKHQESYYRMS